jgi:hypothetical protein
MLDGGIAERIARNAADHRRSMIEAREAYGDICLGSADMNVEASSLQQQLASGRRQPQQQLAEAHNPAHLSNQTGSNIIHSVQAARVCGWSSR